MHWYGRFDLKLSLKHLEPPKSQLVLLMYFLSWKYNIWVFPKIGVLQNGWFIMENPIKMDDLEGKPIIFGNIHISTLETKNSAATCFHGIGWTFFVLKTNFQNPATFKLTFLIWKFFLPPITLLSARPNRNKRNQLLPPKNYYGHNKITIVSWQGVPFSSGQNIAKLSYHSPDAHFSQEQLTPTTK